MREHEAMAAALHEWVAVFMRRSMRHFIHHSRERGLSMSQFGALFHLHRMGNCGVTGLGEHLGVTSAAASQMLERLVQQELIVRAEDPEDRRVKQIALTEKGMEAIRQSMHARQGWLDELVKQMSEAEMRQVTAALKILIEKAKGLDNPGETESNSI